jgi:predicted ATPase
MGFYNPVPNTMRIIRPRDLADRLSPDGANIASMLQVARRTNPEVVEIVNDHLMRILPGLQEIRTDDLRGYDLLSLRQAIENESGVWDAQPDQISDGTLRALAVLVALFQGRIDKRSAMSLVGIEEPETGLHPAAADVLFNALVDASHTTQVLVTTHSPDLLQSGDLDVDSLLAVESVNGVTRIGPVDDVSRSALRDRLFTAGELLQMKQLHPASNGRGSADSGSVPAPATAG